MSANSLYAVVLAAGEASRFGSTKQLMLFRGLPLVTSAIRTAESICGPRSLLVTGNDWKAVAAACKPQQGFMILNSRFAEGLATSLAAGIRSISDVADGALLMLADQPLITSDHLESLVHAWNSSPDSICATAYADTVGPPVIFPRCYFTGLMELSGDRGAKAVINMHRENVVTIHFEDAVADIDHPEDLTKLGSDPD